MRVAVLGAGAGGHAMAAELTLQGHAVRLFSRNPQKLRDLRERGGIEVHGSVLGDRMVPFAGGTGDPGEAVHGAELIALPIPGMLQEQYLELVLLHLEGGQAIWLTPGTGGSLLAHQMLHAAGARRDILLIETLTLPYAARKSGPARVGVVGRFKPRCAAFPARRNSQALALIRQLYEVPPGENVLDTCLGNPNPLIHPLPGLLNWGWIESRDRMFSIYGEGMTPSVVKFVNALDRERVEVAAAVGLARVTIDELYEELGPGPIWRRSMGVGKAEKFEDRFFTEDVPIGLVTMASLGRQLGVRTPLADATIAFANVLCDADFWARGRTAEKLGLAGLDAAGLKAYLQEGVRPGVTQIS